MDKEASPSAQQYPVRRKIRLPRIEYRQGHVFFVTIGAHQRYPWFKLHPTLCTDCVDLLNRLSTERKAILYAWCIMPEHIHILLEDHDMIEFIRLFKGRLTPKSRQLESQRKLWQRSFFDHALRHEESVYQVACYIWENPVRSGLVEHAHEYQWCGSQVWPNFRDFYQSGRG